MIGFSYPPPTFDSAIYNPFFYLSLDASGVLTYDYAQTIYLNMNDYRLSYLNGITPGTATAGVARVLDGSNNISGLGSVSCSTLVLGGSTMSGSSFSAISGVTPGTISFESSYCRCK
ncbi:TPA: hypothetical protein N0F65_009232 [Lagenidium giganteum]|uniref:Uncharacterized protein n=1 Tax=Lagenidium giganteum TaxID=4803 RepID=A0AAV2YTI2_9STRA|nr:TPA: hypothetical protein N0F65_009232 [Lagenidium giganteum]